jgi:hypothetical protein
MNDKLVLFVKYLLRAAVDMSAGGLWLLVQDGPNTPHVYLTVTGSEVYGQ